MRLWDGVCTSRAQTRPSLSASVCPSVASAAEPQSRRPTWPPGGPFCLSARQEVKHVGAYFKNWISCQFKVNFNWWQIKLRLNVHLWRVGAERICRNKRGFSVPCIWGFRLTCLRNWPRSNRSSSIRWVWAVAARVLLREVGTSHRWSTCSGNQSPNKHKKSD